MRCGRGAGAVRSRLPHRDRPPTLGMHRVEEFAFDDGSRTGTADPAGRERTLLDTFADEVLTALAEAYPQLVARLDQLAPPERRTWRERTATLLESPGPLAGVRPAGLGGAMTSSTGRRSPTRWRYSPCCRTGAWRGIWRR
ncbi:hypothetical protein NKH18_17375 [Streptomyces sp. M10(2022)]